MSDILIKSMNMPSHCYTCPCADLEFYDCNLMPGTRIEQHKRLDDCPLISVPPHGDLIDRNALPWEKQGLLEAEEDWALPCSIIKNAPTIIPADQEGEK